MQIIITTRGRADVIGDKTLRLFPDATLCIGNDEQEIAGCHAHALFAWACRKPKTWPRTRPRGHGTRLCHRWRDSRAR